MGGHNIPEDWELDLPAYAFTSGAGKPFMPNFDWLAKTSPAEQFAALMQWWHARYCDPAEDTPYSNEIGYIWIHGGPHDPREIIPEHFERLVSATIIDRVVHELHMAVGDEWAPREEEYEFDDEEFDFSVEAPQIPIERLRERLQQTVELLDLEVDGWALARLRLLVFGALVSGLEAFLWESVQFLISDKDALRALVENLAAFKQQKIVLSDVFRQVESIEKRLKGHLQKVVWHNQEAVARIFAALDVNAQFPAEVREAILKRHDIVHRAGRDQDGKEVKIEPQDAVELQGKIVEYATQLTAQLRKRWLSDGES